MVRKMWSYFDLISPIDLKQYEYCPVIPWLNKNYNLVEPETYSMIEGRREREERYNNIYGKLGLKPPIRFDLKLYYPKKRLIGVADIVAGKRKLTVVEIKRFKRKLFRHFKIQLMTYAYLTEKCIGPTYNAILLIEKRKIVYDVTQEIFKEIEIKIEKLWRTIESEKPPQTSKTAKCMNCWYRKFCPNI